MKEVKQYPRNHAVTFQHEWMLRVYQSNRHLEKRNTTDIPADGKIEDKTQNREPRRKGDNQMDRKFVWAFAETVIHQLASVFPKY